MKNLSSESLNAQEAVERSQEASIRALSARVARDERNLLLELLNAWAGLFNNGMVIGFTLLFILAIILEINFSFVMYEDLMSQITGKANAFMAYFGAFFIVAWGAIVSHYIAKAISKSMYNFAVHNYFNSINGNIPLTGAKEEIRRLTRRDLIIGLVLGLLLLSTVTVVSWQRVILMGEIHNADYSLTHKLLPVLAVWVECITGIYLAYFVRLINKKIRLYWVKRKFKVEKLACANDTKMAFNYYQYAADHFEHLPLAKDLLDVIYRWHHRSLDNDNYVDPVPEQKTLTVKVMDGKTPAMGVHLTGTTTDGNNCNSIYTNENGEGILTWIGESDEVLLLTADGEIYKGPWTKKSSIIIYIRRIRKIKAA